MNSQGITRKRPAPGTTPAVHPPLGAVPNFQNPNPNSQLSNDQFLQWGQNPPANVVNTSFVDPSAYNTAAFAPTQDLTGPAASTSNQLTRRQPPNQLVSRNRGYEQPTTYAENAAGAGTGEGAWGESIEELYNRARTAKREAQAKRKQIPPFVQKLSSFLDESKNTELIRWSDDGNSFIVLDEDEFARRLIPELFKHNNYASFVRQLNMYGFHKKVGLSDNSMRASERKNKSPSEYSNPYFKRGHPELLWLISKPKNAAGHASKGSKGGARVKSEDADDNEFDDYPEDGASGSREDRARPRPLSLLTDSEMPKEQLDGVVQQLKAIRHQQSVISSHIASLRREHEQLSAQAATFQDQHTRHENSINAILTFLATVYNRSLQGQDGSQNLANTFAGAISGDHQGGIVDMGEDFSFSPLASMTSPTGQRTMKKQPLLLKAPPSVNDVNRATTLSPAASGAYDTRSRSQTRQPSATQQGHVEEVLDSSPRQGPTNVSAGQLPDDKFPQKDIMSVIQNSNARNASQNTFSQFPDVLSSLERGGSGPLTPGVRADMLRLMANDTGHHTGSAVGNNALVMPNPPPMPQDYSNRLSNTRQEIDSLVKLQAEQDRSVQNLTNLLQPLSPSGTIPGLDNDSNAPPTIDLDQIFNNDYFTEIPDQKHDHSGIDFGTGSHAHDAIASTEPDAGDASALLDFGEIPGDDDLFNSNQAANHTSYNYGFDGTGYGADAGSGHLDSGRVVEQLTDSEATSPAGPEDPSVEPEDGGSAVKRRRKA